MSLCGLNVAYADSELIGLTRVHLVVENLSKDAEACGITKSMIHDAFMYPASSLGCDAGHSLRITGVQKRISQRRCTGLARRT
jgi:hypothetical protein